MSDLPILVAHEMIHQGCRITVAEQVMKTMEARPDDDSIVLWLRLQGKSYREIGDLMGCSQTRIWRIVQNSLRNCIYSIIEHSTMCVEA